MRQANRMERGGGGGGGAVKCCKQISGRGEGMGTAREISGSNPAS